MDADILEKLTQIEDLLKDIRDGADSRPYSPDYDQVLSNVVSLLERQNTLIYNLGVALCDVNDAVPEYWKNLNRR